MGIGSQWYSVFILYLGAQIILFAFKNAWSCEHIIFLKLDTSIKKKYNWFSYITGDIYGCSFIHWIVNLPNAG